MIHSEIFKFMKSEWSKKLVAVTQTKMDLKEDL